MRTRQTSPFCTYGTREDHLNGSFECPDDGCAFKMPPTRRPPATQKQKTRVQAVAEGAKEIVKIIDAQKKAEK